MSETDAREASEQVILPEMRRRSRELERSMEHDNCGVGFVAAMDGRARRDVVQAGIDALRAVWHRGAVDADGKTGDGAGIHIEIPQDFFRAHISRSGHEPGSDPIAVGMVFLPKTDLGAQERCRTIVETEILAFGYGIYGWRQVPINVGCIGEKANATRPEIEQIMIRGRGANAAEFERDLYVIRRRIEKQAIAAQVGEMYLLQPVVPQRHLQGHVPGREPDGLLSGPAGRAVHQPVRDLSPAVFAPTRSRRGGWRSRSGCWRITARSTRSTATSTG